MPRSQHLSAVVAAAAVGAAAAALFLLRRKRRCTAEGALAEALLRLDRAHRATFSKKGEAQYCEAVEKWAVQLRKLAGEAVSPALRLGARAQHLERGAIPRNTYPEGRDGYLKWRAKVKKRQGERVTELLWDLKDGLGEACVHKVHALVAKSLPLCPHQSQGRKLGDLDGPPPGDAEMQCIEDAACLVFLEEELREGFGTGKDDAKMIDILMKTWKKMSRICHAEALKVDYTPRMLACVVEAIARAELGNCSVSDSSEEVLGPVPSPSSATMKVLTETWAAVQSKGLSYFGEAWYKELQSDPTYACDLGLVLNFPVCRPENVSQAVQMLLDLLNDTADPPSCSSARFRSVLRAASSLSQQHGGFRLRHLDAMRFALVATMRKLTAIDGGVPEKRCQNAWESFGYAVGAEVAPVLLLSDPVSDFCQAVATPLPTPGAGPCAAVLAAQGVALLEMALGILCRKRPTEATELELDGYTLTQLAAKLVELRTSAGRSVCKDAHDYCGLLATAIFDSAGGVEGTEERQRRRDLWTQHCTAVPLDVARGAIEAARLGVGLQASVRSSAPSAIGDLDTGIGMLQTAAQLSLKTADYNITSSRSPMNEFKEASEMLQRSLTTLQASLLPNA